MVAHHHVPTGPGVVDHCTVRGYWRLGLSRLGGRWLITHWAVQRTCPREGSPDVCALADDADRAQQPNVQVGGQRIA